MTSDTNRVVVEGLEPGDLEWLRNDLGQTRALMLNAPVELTAGAAKVVARIDRLMAALRQDQTP
jgi:hypothetical protein